MNKNSEFAKKSKIRLKALGEPVKHACLAKKHVVLPPHPAVVSALLELIRNQGSDQSQEAASLLSGWMEANLLDAQAKLKAAEL